MLQAVPGEPRQWCPHATLLALPLPFMFTTSCTPGNISHVQGGILLREATGEPSHGRGAPEVPEPLTSGAQYLTRYST